jgi:cytochrome c peroxidase
MTMIAPPPGRLPAGKRRVAPLGALAAALLSSGTTGCSSSRADVTPAATPPTPAPRRDANREAINPRLLRRFRPIAQTTPPPVTSPAMIALGHQLFFEPRLSRGGTISCNSCHDLARFGVDHLPTSIGEGGQRGRRNAPTVYNAAEHLSQFWDGRARDVEAQAIGPITNPIEMASTRESVESALRGIPEYREAFRKAFPGPGEPVTLENVGRAIGAFERQLTTRSRWDDYLAGRADALSGEEIQGLRVFLEVGCMGCHTGPQVGASMYQVAGFVEAWPNQKDLGRYEITKVASDRMLFKVPTLKNITQTAPYFHDGSVADLPTAVRSMGRRQLGIELSDDEVSSIVTFFGALEGILPSQFRVPPPLPAARTAKAKG